MPKRLMDCVDRVMKSGKDKSSAFAICIKSTGLKPHKKHKKKSELIDHLVSLADKLDEKGYHKEAAIFDNILKQQIKVAQDTLGEIKYYKLVNAYFAVLGDDYIFRALGQKEWWHGGIGPPDQRKWSDFLNTQARWKKVFPENKSVMREVSADKVASVFGAAPTKTEVQEILSQPAEELEFPDFFKGKTNLTSFEELEGEFEESEEAELKDEKIEEPMPGEVPSAEELEKWLKAHKRINYLIKLANKLDESNLTEEANILDSTLEKEAQWQWFKEKGQQLKDWYQGEKQPNIDVRTSLTKMRQNHWNLVKKLNTAYQLLTKSHKNIGKPEYLRDITSMIQNVLKDIQKSSAELQAITTQKPQQPQQQPPPQTPATPQPPAAPAAGAPPPAPGAAIAPGAALVERLTKLAEKLDAKGNKEAAKVVRAQAQTAMEWGQKGMDWMLGRGKGPRAETDKQWSNFHWRVVSVFKSAYDKLNAVRQYLNDPNTYSERFQAAVNDIQTDLNTILGEVQSAGKPTPAAAAPATTPEEEAAMKETQVIKPADQIYTLMADMTPEQQAQALEAIKQLRGQATPAVPTAPPIQGL